jgi:hypothetical protein
MGLVFTNSNNNSRYGNKNLPKKKIALWLVKKLREFNKSTSKI